MSGRAAQDASGEVAAVIAKFSAAGGKGNIDGCVLVDASATVPHVTVVPSPNLSALLIHASHPTRFCAARATTRRALARGT